MSNRPERVAELMKREVSEILQHRLRDPRIGSMVSVTDVEITRDLAFARVWVTVLASEAERGPVLDALQRAAGFVRRELAPRLGLREVPELRFQHDTSIERGMRVDQILRRLERGEPIEDEEER
uniref:Ribosome-binding factor A n=1 Tax=Eiseniibacteriota bacterium TaxID=2212470 RepID=A0A832I1K0_UNCEI